MSEFLQIGGKRHHKKSKAKGKKRKGGSFLVDLGVPALLLGATQYMKSRKHRKSSKKSLRRRKTRRRR
jgi:hypothetical protein